MTDFRQAGNPQPFTQLVLEADPASLTAGERSAMHHGLSTVARLSSEIFDRVPGSTRGEAARDLNLLARAIHDTRAALQRAADAEKGTT